MFKKNFVIFSLTVFLLTGCSLVSFEKSPAEETRSDEVPIEQRIGVIEKNEEVPGAEATHVLKEDDNTSTPLLSLLINLRKYEGKRAEVTGSFHDEIFFVENVVRLGQETDAKEIYQDLEHGFKVSHSSSWIVTEESAGVVFTPYTAESSENIDRVTVYIKPNPDKKTVKAWLGLDDSMKPASAANVNFYNEVLVGIDQIIGIKETSSDSKTISFYVSREDSIYVLTHSSIGDEDQEMYRNVFFDMAYSFQFIAMSDSDDDLNGATDVEPTDATENAQSDQALETPYEQVKTYFNENIEKTLNADFEVQIIRFAFADDKYVYVEWRGDDEYRKTLFEYSIAGERVYVEKKAEFTPGETRDWNLAEGEDAAAGKKLTVFTGNSEGLVVQEGYRLLEAKSLGVSMQYPRNWYWARQGSGYVFDSKPIEGQVGLAFLSEQTNPYGPGKPMALSEKVYYLNMSDDETLFCVEKSDGVNYICLNRIGTFVENNVVRVMLESIAEVDE